MYSELLKYSQTFGPMEEDFYEWHKGRAKYGVWVLELDDEVFLQRYCQAQQHLSPYLISHYYRKPHITLAPCGFLMPEKNNADDYDAASLMQDVDNILSLDLSVLDCTIRNVLISYAIAPGFEVLDHQGDLGRLNDLLRKADPMDDNIDYFPHITVGLYNAQWCTRLILSALQQFAIEDDIVLQHSVIKLVSYVPTVSGGALQDELMINLSDQSVVRCSEIF